MPRTNRRERDKQRSRVYEWERHVCKRLLGTSINMPDFETLDECDEFARPIWRKERGRVGLARQHAPEIARPHWGQRSALAHADHRITLPRWARSRWVILHEMAHRLTPRDEAHGPRFVGVLMGLVARWMDLDATELMEIADEFGVSYYVRSIGVVPIHGPAWKVARALRENGPMTEMDIACWCDIPYKQVRGAALSLIRVGKARWFRKKLHLIASEAANDQDGGTAMRAPSCRAA